MCIQNPPEHTWMRRLCGSMTSTLSTDRSRSSRATAVKPPPPLPGILSESLSTVRPLLCRPSPPVPEEASESVLPSSLLPPPSLYPDCKALSDQLRPSSDVEGVWRALLFSLRPAAATPRLCCRRGLLPRSVSSAAATRLSTPLPAMQQGCKFMHELCVHCPLRTGSVQYLKTGTNEVKHHDQEPRSEVERHDRRQGWR